MNVTEEKIRKAGQVAIDGVIDGWSDRFLMPDADDLKDYMTRVVDACVSAALSHAPSDDGRCPRPCNDRPADLSMRACLEAGECGCIPNPHRPLSHAPSGAGEAVELNGVADALEYGKGFWRSCSGCHNLNEGVPTGPYSNTMKCYLGGGCFECGGIGAVWDTTDYAEMGRFMAEDVAALPATEEKATSEFTSDDDALELLKTYGHEEAQNGVIRGDWRAFDDKCRAAVNYLCAEWDFVFEDVPYQEATEEKAADVKPEAAALNDFRKFVDLIEGRAMACDGPVTPFLEQLNVASDAEKDRFIAILRALYASPIHAPPSELEARCEALEKDAVIAVARTLLEHWQDFKASDANYEQAYYKLAKYAWNDWVALFNALADLDAALANGGRADG